MSYFDKDLIKSIAILSLAVLALLPAYHFAYGNAEDEQTIGYRLNNQVGIPVLQEPHELTIEEICRFENYAVPSRYFNRYIYNCRQSGIKSPYSANINSFDSSILQDLHYLLRRREN